MCAQKAAHTRHLDLFLQHFVIIAIYLNCNYWVALLSGACSKHSVRNFGRLQDLFLVLIQSYS